MQKQVGEIITLMETHTDENGQFPQEIGEAIVNLFRNINPDERIDAYVSIYTELSKRKIPVDDRFVQHV